MTIGLLQMDLLLPMTRSLKDKRSILSRLKNQVRNKFNVAISELGMGDEMSRSQIGIATISNDSSVAHNILRQTEQFIENHFEVQVVGRRIEML
ncbi:MAG: DUF503 domain-containing protein [Candidatus Marinimicrobia bacterium]|nr:DUF503 domain-containing protein [Candidatus Neomarinimicrobiota bacterium]